MSSLQESLANINARITGIQTRLIALSPNDIIYSALGAVVMYGCKVVSSESTNEYVVELSGQAAGDTINLNPDGTDTPLRGYQYRNIASGPDGAFRSNDTESEVESPPATGLGRFDIAYAFVGPTGAGFTVATGTPSTAAKDYYDTYGMDTNYYGSASIADPVLPAGAIPLARIYVEDVYSGIQNVRIADIRRFGIARYIEDIEFVSNNLPAIEAAASAVTTDNAAFKRQMRVLHYLGM